MTLVQLGHGANGEIEAGIVREECGELGRMLAQKENLPCLHLPSGGTRGDPCVASI